MSIERNILWRDEITPQNGLRFANVHILVGYNQRTVADYCSMADMLIKTFGHLPTIPAVAYDEVHCYTVIESRRVKGCSIVTYDGYIPKGEYPGWFQGTWASVDYHF